MGEVRWGWVYKKPILPVLYYFRQGAEIWSNYRDAAALRFEYANPKWFWGFGGVGKDGNLEKEIIKVMDKTQKTDLVIEIMFTDYIYYFLFFFSFAGNQDFPIGAVGEMRNN